MNATYSLASLAMVCFAMIGCTANDKDRGTYPVVDTNDPIADDSSGDSKDDANGALVSCDPGGRYVCDCGNGHDGNRFCSWDGTSFSECELCGTGSVPMVPAKIYCNVNPKKWLGEEFLPCPVLNSCMPLTCFDHECHYAPAVPSAVLPDKASNDCMQTMCDGYGNALDVPDPDDCNGLCDGNGVCQP